MRTCASLRACRSARIGRIRTCRIEPGGLSVAEQSIGDRRSIWDRRFDRLGDSLAELDEK
jgi:hypothetical protein